MSMSHDEIKTTQDALLQIEAARKAVGHAALRARACDECGLGTLAREWDHFSKGMEHAITLQIRVLKGNLPPGFQGEPQAPEVAKEQPAAVHERTLDFTE